MAKEDKQPVIDLLPEYEGDFVDSEGMVRAGEVLPDEIPLLPLSERPMFPGITVPILLKEGQWTAVNFALARAQQTIGLVLALNPEEEPSPTNLHQVGVAAKVVRAMGESEGDVTHILVNGLRRFKILATRVVDGVVLAKVEYNQPLDEPPTDELKAYAMAIVTTLKELVQLNPLQGEAIRMFLDRSSLEAPELLTDFAANLTTAEGSELQDVLESWDVRKRIEKVLLLLKKEVELAKIQQQIQSQIEEKLDEQQRQFFLREQLKAIKQELGIQKEGKQTELDEFKERMESLNLSEEASRVIKEEMTKFELLEPASPEYSVTRNYLDWLTVLPWGVLSKDSFNVRKARKVLDEDHFGLDDVKERILEFIAVGKMRGEISGSILCLVGPPGVGKTSIGRSIAEAIGRRFYRFSLGGMRDEAEIKGHRRTYIGAMPGKFIQSMKLAGTANPVLMLDEIDKIGASFRGDPASALLEVLDPEQNETFRDHYLDVAFDLSNVMFVATANQLDTIPRPLLDRMEVIRLSGYILEEKIEIATRYIVPKAMKRHGISTAQFAIGKRALRVLIDGWAREAGVRNLEKCIHKLLRKAAMKLATNKNKKITIQPKDLEPMLGPPMFEEENVFVQRPGVVTGLAWTSMGGATLQIEATAVPSKRHGFRQTGQLGNVMIESAQIAYSYVMARLEDYKVAKDYFENHYVHIHVPAGATPKDGPSAGVTMATALISMVTGIRPRAKLAMTGELSLTGQVLPIGGVKEKVIAARRVGAKHLVFPSSNQKDVEELPEYLRRSIQFYFAETYDDVFKVAFPRA